MLVVKTWIDGGPWVGFYGLIPPHLRHFSVSTEGGRSSNVTPFRTRTPKPIGPDPRRSVLALMKRSTHYAFVSACANMNRRTNSKLKL